MRRRFAETVLSLLFLALVGVARDAVAAPNDKEVEDLIQSVLEQDYPAANWKDGAEKLDLAKQACEGQSCSSKVRAKLFLAIGTIAAADGKKKEAVEAFTIAIAEEPGSAPFASYVTPQIQAAFDEAKGGAPAAPEKPPTAPSTAGPTRAKRTPKKKFPGGGRAPRGWKSAEAYFYAMEAQKSEAAREWLDCTDYAQASLGAESRVATRYIAAGCEERAGLWLEAIGDYQAVASTTERSGITETIAQAKQKGQALKEKIPKIVIHKPAKADNLVVTMNDVELPIDKLGGEIWVNPGDRTIRAKGTVEGVELEFEQSVTIAEFESATVDIKLAPKGAKSRDSRLMKCMLSAESRDDFAKCLSGGVTSTLNLHFGSELSGYHDTDHVDVVSPAFFASVENPTSGWGVNGSFLVDVVTAASADIVANASPRWNEVRYVPGLGGHKKFGDVDVAMHGILSHEPDYLATSIGATASLDLRDKTITPALGYEFSHDVSGRSGTPFKVYSHEINRHGFDGSVTFILDKATFLATTLTAVFEVGDSSKPYRYVPMFDARKGKNGLSIVDQVEPGIDIDTVNQARLPIRVLEQLPTSRQRYAIAGLIAHRFASSTFRAEERLYADNWGLKASTTDARYLIDMTPTLRIWPQGRFNVQSAVDFWQLAYAALPTTTDIKVPALRTGDKELGPLLGLTLGGGARLAFGEKKNWGLTVTGSVLYNRYFDHLYILERYAFFGATTMEVDFE